jgi:hypothetical protein
VFNAGAVSVAASEITGQCFHLRPYASAPEGVTSQAFDPSDGEIQLTDIIPKHLLEPLRPIGRTA